MERKEAIKILMGYSHTPQERAALEVLIPELAESEDERIRKEIINFLRSPFVNENITDEKVAPWIAYIERQKECVSNNFDDVWDEEDCEEIIAEGQKLSPRFKGLLKEVCHAWYDRGAKSEKQKEPKPLPPFDVLISEEEMNHPLYLEGFDTGREVQRVFDEQKPTEWSEEDERILDSIINAFRNGKVSTIGQEQWLKSLPERFNLQPQQEWSEEDKRKLNRIYEILGHAADEKPFGSSKRIIGDKEAVELQDFIKSLRPSWKPSDVCYGIKGDPDPAGVWKPSEEQMKALLNAEGFLRAGLQYDSAKTIAELYEQLKKL